jgi:hypothetical protein
MLVLPVANAPARCEVVVRSDRLKPESDRRRHTMLRKTVLVLSASLTLAAAAIVPNAALAFLLPLPPPHLAGLPVPHLGAPGPHLGPLSPRLGGPAPYARFGGRAAGYGYGRSARSGYGRGAWQQQYGGYGGSGGSGGSYSDGGCYSSYTSSGRRVSVCDED